MQGANKMSALAARELSGVDETPVGVWPAVKSSFVQDTL